MTRQTSLLLTGAITRSGGREARELAKDDVRLCRVLEASIVFSLICIHRWRLPLGPEMGCASVR
jgi:hypothetical protein